MASNPDVPQPARATTATTTTTAGLSPPPGSSSLPRSSSNIRAAVSPDSDGESPLNCNENLNNSSCSGSSSSRSTSVGSDSSEVGFVSGEEDFEALPESDRPFVRHRDEVAVNMADGEGDEDEDEDVESFIEACEDSPESSAIPVFPGMPIAKVSTEDDVVEGEGVKTVEGVLGEKDGDGSFENSKLNECVSVISDVEVNPVAEKNEVNPVVEKNEDVFEEPNKPADPVSTGKGELVMEIVQEKVVMGGSTDDFTAVWELQKEVPVDVDESIPLDDGHGHIRGDAEELVDFDSKQNEPNDAIYKNKGDFVMKVGHPSEAAEYKAVLGDSTVDLAGVDVLNWGKVVAPTEETIDFETLQRELLDERIPLAKGHEHSQDDAEAVVVDTDFKLNKPYDATSKNNGDFVMGVEHPSETDEVKAVLGDSTADIKGVATLDQVTEETTNDSETLQKELPFESNHSDSGFEHGRDDAEGPVDAESVGLDSNSKNIIESAANFDVGIAASEPLNEKTDASDVGKIDETIGMEVVEEDNIGGSTMDCKTNVGPETSVYVETVAPGPLQKRGDASDVGKADETIGKESVEEDTQVGATMDSSSDSSSKLRAQGNELEVGVSCNVDSSKSTELSSILNKELTMEVEDDANQDPDDSDTEGSIGDEEAVGVGMVFGSSESNMQFLKELGQGMGTGSQSSEESSNRVGATMDSSSDNSKVRAQGNYSEVGVSHNVHSSESVGLTSMLNKELMMKVEDEANQDPDDSDTGGSIGDGEAVGTVLGNSESTIQFLKELDQGMRAGSQSSGESSFNQGGATVDSSSDSSIVRAQGNELEVGVSHNVDSSESAELCSMLNKELTMEVEDEANEDPDDGDTEGSIGDGEAEGMIFGSSETAKQFLKELGQGMRTGSQSSGESSFSHAQGVDGQIVTDSDEEVDTDEAEDGKELFDSNALAALLKAATNAGADGGRATVTSQDGSRIFSLERPAGLGSSLRAFRPGPQQPSRSYVFGFETEGDSEKELTDEERRRLEKLQQIRVKFLRLVQRLGYSPEDSMAQHVLYRLALTIRRDSSQAFTFDAAKRTASQLEAEGKDDLSFSLNILAIGKSGVGKSATINSIFGEERAVIDAFEPTTTVVKEIVGVVGGVKLRVFDTPGLRSSLMEQGFNNRVLSSIKKHTKRFPPDIVLYVDRLDSQTRDLNDLPLLRSITSSLGSSIWKNAIVTYTHAGSAPPDGPSGFPMSYEVFVAQRSNVVQQSIAQAIGDLRLMNPTMVNPVTLVENHPSCRKNREGQKVLPNGQTWKPQLLLLCYSLKILSEVSGLSKHDTFDHRKIFGFHVRPPHLPYLLTWLLQSRTHPKLSGDPGVEIGDSEIDLDDMSDSDPEDDEDEYDQLPPFKPLRKSQIAKLSNEQRKAYLEEYDYRVKLLQKKQWKEELKRMKEIKKKGKVASDDHGYLGDDFDQDNEGPAGVHVPLPDLALPVSFDSDNPGYRYRFLEPTSQFLVRPVLDTHAWDHDFGYDGVNVEYSQAIIGRFPASVVAQITKDKNDFTIHLDSSIAAKHGEKGSSLAGVDIQNIGKQLAYILRGETKLKSWRKNKTTAGVSVTFVGENVAPGAKIENQITLGKRLVLVGNAGTVRSQGDAAYGANLEMRLRDADFPIVQDHSTLGLNLVKWRGDLSLGANLHSQFSMGRSSKMVVRMALNNKMSGHITIRSSSSDYLQIGLIGILPIVRAICKNIWPGDTEDYSIH